LFVGYAQGSGNSNNSIVMIHNWPWLAKEPMVRINAWIMPEVTKVQYTTTFIAPKSATDSRNRLVYLSTGKLKAGRQWIECLLGFKIEGLHLKV